MRTLKKFNNAYAKLIKEQVEEASNDNDNVIVMMYDSSEIHGPEENDVNALKKAAKRAGIECERIDDARGYWKFSVPKAQVRRLKRFLMKHWNTSMNMSPEGGLEGVYMGMDDPDEFYKLFADECKKYNWTFDGED